MNSEIISKSSEFLDEAGNEKKVLHLSVHLKWFLKIKNGEKKIEYRQLKPYWISRLMESTEPMIFKKWDIVRIRNGYGKQAPTVEKKWVKTGISFGGDLGNDVQFAIFLEDLHD